MQEPQHALAQLDGATQALYRAFAPYRRPSRFAGCACCWDGDATGHAGTVAVPAPGGERDLDLLEPEELSTLAAKVPTTAGGLDVYKHYLPRLLQLAAEDRFGYPDPEIVFSRLRGHERWPAVERDAIGGFLDAFWRWRLSAGDDAPWPDIDTVLCAIGLACEDVAPYLRTWLRFEQRHAGAQLLLFVERNVSGRLDRGRLFNSFWGSGAARSPNVDTVIGWMRSPDTATAVAAAFDRTRHDGEAEALYQAYQLLARW